MKNFAITFILTLFLGLLYGNSPFFIRETLEWKAESATATLQSSSKIRWGFKGAVYGKVNAEQPWFIKEFAVDGPGQLDIELINVRWEEFPQAVQWSTESVGESLKFFSQVEKDRRQFFGKVYFVPVIRRGGQFLRAAEFELKITLRPENTPELRSNPYADNSVLRDGQIFKFAVTQNGVHRLSYDFLKNQLKIDIDRVDPRNIKILGQGGGVLPMGVNESRTDDLVENHIVVVGEDDGKFDAGDYILLYAEGPDHWTYQAGSQRFNMTKNIYDTRNYYFVKIASERGLRVSTQASLSNATYTSNGFDDYARLEEDKVNLLESWESNANSVSGSGRNWFGTHFRVARENTFAKAFTFPNIITDQDVKVNARMALRALDFTNFSLDLNGTRLTSGSANNVYILDGTSATEVEYANYADLNGTIRLTQDVVDAVVRYPLTSTGSEGWLDYIQVQARRRLIMVGDQMPFRDISTLNQASASYSLSNTSADILVWDITDPQRPKLQEGTRTGNQISFGVSAGGILHQFIAFNSKQGFLNPVAVGKIDNQNLHGLRSADLVIVYDAAGEFQEAAQKLAQHRREYSKLEVQVVRLDQIYHEFASGRADPTAIRDFAKMLYTRSPKFRYLLLMGDGSFDQRDIYKYGNNFIPTFQEDSLNPLYAFPADDYYGILENNLAFDPLNGRLNVAVGRLTVRKAEEATQVVDKIINYDLSPQSLSDWRNRVLFVGDDEDGNLHTRDCDEIAQELATKHPDLNADKFYLDAFPQVASAGGNFYPAVNEAINNAIFKGTLVMTYLGHGGPNGWAQERILQVRDVQNWTNFDRLPLVVTATCSFTGYDDASNSTAGEEVLLNPRGGAVALYSTVRAVYASENASLTRLALLELFEAEAGASIGDAMRNAKNQLSGGTLVNSRKFALIGDPSMILAIPRHNVQTLSINGKPAQSSTDTLRALQKVSIEGQLVDAQGNVLNDFNGIVHPTVFDKPFKAATLGQDPSSPKGYQFEVQKNVIFKGRASVRNGRFSFSFVVPKDINYAFGLGKISYYAADTVRMVDANGAYKNINIGGNSPAGLADNQGPVVDVYMNSLDFVFGGVTNPDPLLLVRLRDDNGINVVGNSIGHDLEAVLDENTQNSLLLNDFFTSELDDYTKGEVRYPIAGLAEGVHKIRVKAWDIANNSNEGYTEFVVASSENIALKHVLNYPNPFTDRTCFQFEHSANNQQIDVLVQIYTIAGRLVKTLESSLLSDGALRQGDCIEWDGKDDYGDRLARGVYLYKVKVRANLPGGSNLQGESKFEKLVLLK